MNLQNWKIFDKKGSQINWVADPMINLIFNSPTGRNAEGFLITDPEGRVVSSKITNSGYLYNQDVSLLYTYTLSDDIKPLLGNVIYKDVSVFNPNLINTMGIKDIENIDASGFVYPSFTYAAAIFLEPVSQGLVETEHLFIFEETSIGYIRPHDASEFIVVMEFVGDDDEIKFFEVNDETQEIIWSDAIAFDISIYAKDIPLQVNIGFKSDVEGVFERILRIYHLAGDTMYTIADIVVNAESIGEDERFRTLISNFGLPDPKDIPHVFKETNINEDSPDWKTLNYKSKHMILEHDKIMPYVGTYKALINAIKWLGYDDIFVREWFLNVKENKKLSFIIPFDAKDRSQTILMFNTEERKVLKKLNELTLNYCLTRETDEIDTWGTPITKNCYSYNIKEIFIKLLGLKQWLERHIIGINCRITDITGEGIYFERIQNLIYATTNVGKELPFSQSLSPYSIHKNSELVFGEASIHLSFLEMTKTTIEDLKYKFIDMVTGVWYPSEEFPYIFYSIDDPSYLANPSAFLHMGPTFGYPFKNILDISYRVSTEKEAGVISETLVTNPLFIYNNEIRFYNIFDSSSVFYDISTNLTILLEKAYLRDPNIDKWTDSIAYSIYPDPSNIYDYIMESSMGIKTYFSGYATFIYETGSRLEYSIDNNYHVPLLRFNGFKYTDPFGINSIMGDYYLDIIDGKIYMNAGITQDSYYSVNILEVYLNFHYDTSLNEQKITFNPVYTSPRMGLYQIDPYDYYWSDRIGFTGGNNPNNYVLDNSIYDLVTNYTGDYNIEMFAWDAYNTKFFNVGKETHSVWMKSPMLGMFTDVFNKDISISTNDVSILINDNLYPIYDRSIPLQGLRLEFDNMGDPYIVVPSITFFQDLPEKNSINKFFNLTERVTHITTNSITIDPDYQSFSGGDIVRLVKFNKGNYNAIEEITLPPATSGTSTFLQWSSAVIPSNFINDNEHQIYVINDTLRNTTNISNVNGQLILSVPGYSFLKNQLVGIIVEDISTGYSWGSSYRIVDISGNVYIFDAELPQQFIDDSSKYNIKAKHAFSTFSTISIHTDSATEINNEFRIYLKDSYCQEYYLDNTFTYMNILFDQERINNAWYDPSLMLHNKSFYNHSNINMDTSSLVIIKSLYDEGFYTDSGFFETPTDIALQSDGKILLGGHFTLHNWVSANRIIRLNSNGTRDNTFNIGTGFNAGVNAIALQPDGKVLVGGNFITYQGVSANRIIRLNPDGSRDNTFNIGTGFNTSVNTITLQPDGRILVGGDFATYQGVSANRIIRLNSGGTRDNTFNIGTGFNAIVNVIALQSDGKVLVGGELTTYQDISANRMIRLNPDGSRDNTFNIGTGFNWWINSIAIQPNGKILLGGHFTLHNGVSVNRIIRLNSNGTRDNTFNIGTGFNAVVNAIALQPDGKVLVGGNFITYQGVSANRIIRLNPDGSRDNTFNIGTGFNSSVFTIALQPDGKILIVGSFSLYQNIIGSRIVKLNYDGTRLDNPYIKDQNNIFAARFNNDDTTYFKVFNDSVPIIFNEKDIFKINAESYDKYGNLVKSKLGFINTLNK